MKWENVLKRDIVSILLLLVSLGYIFPITPAWRAIIFIFSLDLLTFPLPFGKIIAKIVLLLFILPFLSSLPLFSLIKFDIGLAYLLIIVLIIGEVLTYFVPAGKFFQAIIKALIVFVAGLFALGFDTKISGILAGGIFILNFFL